MEEELKGKVSIQYLFMNEKYCDEGVASEKLTDELDDLCSKFTYDAVILGDEAAFDYAIENRDKYFPDISLIYE
ncbi:MAG: hypothetical protein GX663_06365 [Clostridiales bacterium]|nr:hypothetical protein [Clostridiales bacterium]